MEFGKIYSLEADGELPYHSNHGITPPSWFARRRLARKAARGLRRSRSAVVELKLRRPLSQDYCYPSVLVAFEEDYKGLAAKLVPSFRRRGLAIQRLELEWVKRGDADGNPERHPYDIVKATITVTRAKG